MNLIVHLIKARFPFTAELFARFGAADREFEKVNDKLRASIAADVAGKVIDSIQNINRSLFYAENLRELDEEGFISATVRRQSLDFVKDKARDAAWEDEDLDDMADRLRAVSRF